MVGHVRLLIVPYLMGVVLKFARLLDHLVPVNVTRDIHLTPIIKVALLSTIVLLVTQVVIKLAFILDQE